MDLGSAFSSIKSAASKATDAALKALGVHAPVGIRNGMQCTNNEDDQRLVLTLLCQIPEAAGGRLGNAGPVKFKTPVQGHCDPALANSIRAFQQRNGLRADGVVDPGGASLCRR